MDEFDLEELKEMFLEECREHVDTLERGLLEMSNAERSNDLLNEVFRAAHSIKGGGATFGFADLAELTHHMETLLDLQRSGEKAICDEDIELLLESLDVVRELMEALGEGDHPQRLPLQARLEAACGVASDSPAGSGDAASPAPEQEPGENRWRIEFRPKPELMLRGNDPLLMLRELQRLGTVAVEPHLDALPELVEFEPKSCYLPWTASLVGSVSREDIAEVFEWVEFDCEVGIELLPAGEAADPESAASQPDAGSATPDDALAEQAGPAEKPAHGDSESAPAAKTPKKSKPAADASIRVSTEKIDQLINLVGELVINQSMLTGLTDAAETVSVELLRERLSELERNTRQLQEGVMQVRMLPLSMGFGRLPRLVRDLSRKLDKSVELVVEGADTEIDKTVLEQMMDPLVHLVRNAVDHGLETPEDRAAAGKPETGELRLSAYHRSGSVVIEIADDGKGIDSEKILGKAVERGIVGRDESLTENEIHQLIFAPGFSTAEVVSDVSGRGVGMDVVRRNIIELGGQVDIESALGVGTTITIRLPLTLAILDGQLVSCGGEDFVVPLANIIETVELAHCSVSELPQSGPVFLFREEYLPLVDLHEEFGLESTCEDRLIVVLESHGRLFGLMIDGVLGQQQIVIKGLEENYYDVRGIAGATIMSDGRVALIIDAAAFAPSQRLSSAA